MLATYIRNEANIFIVLLTKEESLFFLKSLSYYSLGQRKI